MFLKPLKRKLLQCSCYYWYILLNYLAVTAKVIKIKKRERKGISIGKIFVMSIVYICHSTSLIVIIGL